jgi:hypothetical protein
MNMRTGGDISGGKPDPITVFDDGITFFDIDKRYLMTAADIIKCDYADAFRAYLPALFYILKSDRYIIVRMYFDTFHF